MLGVKKRILLLTMVLVICLYACSICNADSQSLSLNTAVNGSQTALIGDVNGDGVIDAWDFSYMKQFLLGKITDLPVNDDLYAGDLDGDEKITVLDFSILKQYLLGIITKFPKKPDGNNTIRIMPLGDSITDGFAVAGGYRIKLWKNITSNGYKVDFVGSSSNGPEELGDKNHEGHSGWHIDQIDSNINAWMDVSKPEIVLLHIGTNDILHNYDMTKAPSLLGSLIDKICTKLPAGGKLYVAKITPLNTKELNQKVQNYNTQISEVVRNKVNLGKPVYVVDMYTALTAGDLADGIHPNRAGYDKMADVWYYAIRGELTSGE